MSVSNRLANAKVETLDNGEVLVSPPSTNRGGISANNYKFVATGKNGSYQIVKLPNKNKKSHADSAFIDWLSFSFKIDSFYKSFPFVGSVSNCDEDVVYELSEQLNRILGFGVTGKKEGKVNFYDSAYNLGDNWGVLCIGGKHQNGTCLVTINGTGLLAIRERKWARKMIVFFKKIDAKITRVDATADFFEGEYTVDQAAKDYLEGDFNNGGSKTSSHQAGNWLSPDGTGRTFYAGKKENGKECCIYEKGLQLGGNFATSFKNWTRVELRLYAKDRVIPYDILLFAGQYLAAGYPALNFISKIQCKIKTAKAKVQVEYEKAKAVLKHQFGGLIFAIVGADGTLKDVIGDDVPKRLITPDVNFRVLSNMEDPYKVDESGALEMAFI